MKTVWKFQCYLHDSFTLNLPRDSQILSVQIQNGVPHLWALVDPSQPMISVKFRLAGTGHTIEEEDLSYVGTFQIAGGSFVFHLFRIDEQTEELRRITARMRDSK